MSTGYDAYQEKAKVLREGLMAELQREWDSSEEV